MFRAVGSVLKRNKELIYGITRGSTSSSHRAFTSNVTSSTTGQKAPTFRKMSTFRKMLIRPLSTSGSS
ncbi:hypothetical protein YC2023_118286 [Brassica napus]